jgi:hypothetical protein
MYKFCKAVVAAFGPHDLQGPNKEETACMIAKTEARGFPEMLGSIDCMSLVQEELPNYMAMYIKGTKDIAVWCPKSC